MEPVVSVNSLRVLYIQEIQLSVGKQTTVPMENI